MKIEIEHLKTAVMSGGGQWERVQEAIEECQPAIVLFRSPLTGQILALPVQQCTSEKVHEKILLDCKKQSKKPVKMSRDMVVHFIDRLREMADQLESLTEEKP